MADSQAHAGPGARAARRVVVMAVVSGLQVSERFGRRFVPGPTALVAGPGAMMLATGGLGHG